MIYWKWVSKSVPVPPKSWPPSRMPAPIPCSAPVCTYLTPENLPTYDLQTTHLHAHTDAAHPTPAQPGSGGPQPGHGHQKAKVDKSDMSEQRATNIQGQTLVNEIRSCMCTWMSEVNDGPDQVPGRSSASYPHPHCPPSWGTADTCQSTRNC